MNKYSKLGMELLEYKTELSKNYPDLVLKSLKSSIDELASNDIIDVDIHYALKGSDTNIDSLKELLLTKSNCVKTEKELLLEYDVIKDHFIETINITENIQAQSLVEKEQIALIQDFIMTEEFIRDYFFIESEKDFETLMGRKGFLHKFAILRLEKILKDFIKQSSITNITHSPVFYNEIKNVYGIQLVYNYNIVELENEEKLNESAIIVKDIIINAIDFYNKKMGV